MKVSEAMEKVCPFITNSGEYAWQHGVGEEYTPSNIKCICEDCMAWQYTRTDTVTLEREGYCMRIKNENN